MEVLGEPLVSGDAAAIPVRYTSDQAGMGQVEGFIVIAGRREASGLVVAGSASLFAQSGATTDQAVAVGLLEEFTASWNADDAGGVLATMTEDVAVWFNMAYADSIGSAADLEMALPAAFSLSMEATGPPLLTGPFIAAPLLGTDAGTGEAMGAIAILWVDEGKIALLAFAMGESSGG
jgi:hypothetical protein